VGSAAGAAPGLEASCARIAIKVRKTANKPTPPEMILRFLLMFDP
jgi:hypothetical protein